METPEDELDQRIEALMNQGFDHLEQDEYEEALEVAQQLEEMQFTGAFEIAALAHDGMDDVDEAVRVLHRGVEAAPDCWPNWELLGNYLSDLERYEEAEEAYEQALQCDDPWTDSIRLNQAILAGRREWYGKALELLDTVDDPKLELQTTENRIANLKGLDRIEEARTLAEQVLAGDLDEEQDGDILARIAARLGQIRLAAGEDKAELRELAFRWLNVDPGSDLILDLIRHVDGKFADRVRYYRLLLHAEIPATHFLSSEATGYFVSYDVIAETAEEAFELLREFEDPELMPGLQIEEIELDADAKPDEPKGVCRRSPMHLYEGEG